jgi:glycosyltransferase involved in cell wall biosynthesis
MKIGLNGQKLLIDQLAGPEVYTCETFKAFAKLDDKNEYVVYFEKEPPSKLWQEVSQGKENFSYKVVSKKLSWTHLSLGPQLLKDKPDIFFAANHTMPLIRPCKTKFVSMIHGLEYKINRQFYKNPAKFFLHPFLLWYVLIFSKIIIVPSKATKDAILAKKWPFLKKQKIRVVYEGVNQRFYQRDKKEVEKIRQKYEIGDSPYLLFVSTVQPRKNIPRMVAGFSEAIKNDKELKDCKLLISGKLGWLYQDSLDAPKKYGVEDAVVFLGRTPDEDLPALLTGAEYFISCSLDEGFGIPLLEAMACQTPAIVSDIPAFRELGRNLPIYVEPKNITEIKKGIIRGLKNPPDKKKLRDLKERANFYTWEKGAQQLISIFESFFKNL